MPQILETEHFTVDAPDKPHHSRENGGHLKVAPKRRFAHRYEMPLDLATELMHLTMIVGEATTKVLRQKGIDVVRINYQDNGNWAYKPDRNLKPHLHIHLYGRTNHEKHPTNNPKFQAFPDALVFPDPNLDYYDEFKPLTQDDCIDIRSEITSLVGTFKYDGCIKLLAA